MANFGYDQIGGSTQAIAAVTKRFWKFTTPSGAAITIQSINAYCNRSASGSGYAVDGAIYTDNAGAPNGLVADSAIQISANIARNAPAWYSVDYSTKPVLQANTTYWIGVLFTKAGVTYHTTGGTNQEASRADTLPFDDPFGGSPTYANNQGSCYLAYSIVKTAAATLTGAGAMTSAALRVKPRSATLAGEGVMTATAQKTAAAKTASATLSGEGAMTSAALRLRLAATALVGSGSLTVTAQKTDPVYTRMFTFGFGTGDGKGGVGQIGTPGNPSTAAARTGTYGWRCTSLVSGAAKGYRCVWGTDTNGPFFTRIYFRYGTAPSAENTIFAIRNAANTVRCRITIDGSGLLRLYDAAGTQIGSASSALNVDTWYNIEMKLDTSPASGSRVIEARLSGTIFASTSTSTVAQGANHIAIGGNLASETQTQGTWDFDDLAADSSVYVGVSAVGQLQVDSAGDASDWTNDYTAVDEVSPNDGTDLVFSNTLNQIDDHNMQAAAGDTDAVRSVCVAMRFRGNTGTPFATFVMRVKASSGGTVEESTGITPTGTSWNTNANGTTLVYPLVLNDLPGASTTKWTKANVDAMQVGYRLSATSTNGVDISTVWALVEYTQTSTKPAAASLTGSAAMTAAAILLNLAAATLSGAATLTAVAKGIYARTATLSGTGTVTASAIRTYVRSATLAGAGTLAATAKLKSVRSATLVGSASMTAFATKSVEKRASVSLTGSAILSASAMRRKSAAASLFGAATLTATAKETHVAAAVLSGTGTLTSTASNRKRRSAALIGSATITASATKSATLDRSATLVGSASITVAAKGKYVRAAALTGSATLTSYRIKIKARRATMSGRGAVTVTAKQSHVRTATLSGAATLITHATRIRTRSVALAGAATLTATARKILPAAASLSGSSALFAVGAGRYVRFATFTGSANMTASAYVFGEQIYAAAVLSGMATLTVFGIHNVSGAIGARSKAQNTAARSRRDETSARSEEN